MVNPHPPNHIHAHSVPSTNIWVLGPYLGTLTTPYLGFDRRAVYLQLSPCSLHASLHTCMHVVYMYYMYVWLYILYVLKLLQFLLQNCLTSQINRPWTFDLYLEGKIKIWILMQGPLLEDTVYSDIVLKYTYNTVKIQVTSHTFKIQLRWKKYQKLKEHIM